MTSTPSELLVRLDYAETKSFPKKAIQEIIARREEMIPHLLAVLESAHANPGDYVNGRKAMFCTYAAYLLAQFRETRAYRPLMALLNLGGNIPSDVFGDSISEDMHNIVASVYDGDEELLRKLIENSSADEYARACAGLKAYPVLVHAGMLTMESVENYFRELFEGKLQREHCHVWNSLCSMSGDLGFASLLPHVRKAFEEGLCDRFFDHLTDIERRAKSGGDVNWSGDCQLVNDVVPMMEWWACFHPETPRKTAKAAPDALAKLLETREFSSRPTVPPQPKYPGVTRNDPCPCGSGRKFKKCCGG
jgi:Protein of unknown function (DUF1186)/SEC-C motif